MVTVRSEQGAAWKPRVLTWKGDHSPHHVHVYRDGKLIVKWNLDDRVAMKGRPSARVLQLIAELERKGIL
jgi:hypothetical protein